MYAFIKGIVVDKTEENLVLENQGIGYNIKISAGTLAGLPARGEEVLVYTYTSVREDAFVLYGFLRKEELEMFKMLITVSGIGPKGGLSILSVMDVQDLRFAILSQDAKMIAKAPGIGARTAQRVILELKDKISAEETITQAFTAKETTSAAVDTMKQIQLEAQEALVALGYSNAEALKAVRKVEITEDMDTETLLRAAISHMAV